MTDEPRYASLQGRLTYGEGETFHISAPRTRIMPLELPETEIVVDENDPRHGLVVTKTVSFVDLRMEAHPDNPLVVYGVSRRASYDPFVDAVAKMIWDPTPENMLNAAQHLPVDDWRDLETVTKAVRKHLA